LTVSHSDKTAVFSVAENPTFLVQQFGAQTAGSGVGVAADWDSDRAGITFTMLDAGLQVRVTSGFFRKWAVCGAGCAGEAHLHWLLLLP
jgi:hypothetical protein